MSNDDAIGTVLWLAAGGAAGYAVGRWLVAPRLVARPLATATQPASSISAPRVVTAPKIRPSPRALAAGPSGDMRPIDPYADTAPSVAVPPVVSVTTTPPTTSLPTSTAVAVPTVVDGPITMPSQVAISSAPTSQIDARPVVAPPVVVIATAPNTQTPRRAFATSDRVRRFDPVFERYRGTLPIEYVRALVERESNGRPSVRAGNAVGLMQIVPVVLTDYNKRHGTAYRSEHLADPAINVAIGCELLGLIVESYRKHHPRIASLQADWNNPRFVELLTLGWNAGFSEAGGVGRVARYLEELGALDLTIDQVSAHAKLAGASKHLSNPAKVAWCKSVVALYQRERALGRAAQTFVST